MNKGELVAEQLIFKKNSINFNALDQAAKEYLNRIIFNLKAAEGLNHRILIPTGKCFMEISDDSEVIKESIKIIENHIKLLDQPGEELSYWDVFNDVVDIIERWHDYYSMMAMKDPEENDEDEELIITST